MKKAAMLLAMLGAFSLTVFAQDAPKPADNAAPAAAAPAKHAKKHVKKHAKKAAKKAAATDATKTPAEAAPATK